MKRSLFLSSSRIRLGGLACLLQAMLLWSGTGCSRSDRPKTVPVTGRITLKGNQPQFSGALFFAPVEPEEGYPRRGGRALFDPDGAFEVSSFEPGDGLIPGSYRVRVESWKQVPAMGKPGVSNVPRGFQAPDVVVSSQDGTVHYDLELSP